MLNTLVICRHRYNSLRHNPLELIWMLNFFAVAEENGTYTIKKNCATSDMGSVSAERFNEIMALYK